MHFHNARNNDVFHYQTFISNFRMYNRLGTFNQIGPMKRNELVYITISSKMCTEDYAV